MKNVLLLFFCTCLLTTTFGQTIVYLGSQITNGETGGGCVADCSGATIDPVNGDVCLPTGSGNHTLQASSTVISVPAGEFLDIAIETNDCTGATDGLDGGDNIMINDMEVVTGASNLQVNYAGCFSNPTAGPINVTVTLNANRRDETVIVTYTVVAADPGGCTALPIELSYFEGKLEGDMVALEWKTETEENNDYFVVERSLDGKTFEPLTKMQGAGTTVEVQEYSFKDEAPFALNYYRLKQVDFDGRYAYSAIITVNTITKNTDTKLYPTPTTGALVIETIEEFETVEIFDITGRVLKTLDFDLTPVAELNVSELVSGSYFVALKRAQGTEMIRFIKK